MLDVAIRRSLKTAPSDDSDVTGSELDGPTVCRLDGALDEQRGPVVRALRGRLGPREDFAGGPARHRARSTGQGSARWWACCAGAHPGVGRVRVCADQPALVRLLRAEGLDRLFPLVSRPDQPAVAARP